jgi:polysaccharide biosynthesis transport protein
VNQSSEQGQAAISTNSQPPMPQAFFPDSLTDSRSFTSFRQFLRKRIWIVLGVLILGLGAAETLNFVMRPRYTALAQIEIVPDLSSEFSVSQSLVSGSGTQGSEKLETEIQILRSPTLGLSTIQALHLDNNPLFAKKKNGRAWNLALPADRGHLEAMFGRALSVERFQHTDIIQVKVTTHDPALSGLIANTLIDKYIERSFHSNYSATERISGWLNTQLESLRKNLEKSQSEMVAYQKELGLVGLSFYAKGGSSGGSSILVSNLDEMIKQSADATVNRMMKEALYNAIKDSPPDVIDTTAMLANPALLASKQSLIQLQNEYASMSKTYGKAYPKLQALQSQIDDLQKKVADEEQNAIATAQKQFEAAKAYEATLKKTLNGQEQDLFGKGEQVANFEFALEQYESNRMLYDGLQERLQQAAILSGLHTSSIQIVDSADIPAYPSFPRSLFNLAVGGAVGLLLGIGLALLIEGLDVNLKTITEIEEGLGLPLLTAIPSVKTEEITPETFREHAIATAGTSWSRIAEALRSMRTAILLSSPGSPPKVLLIASARPSEGKSSVATLFGITLALGGARVLVIDADLRRPSVHLRFRIGKHSGLSSVLSGKSELRDAIIEWPPLPNLHLMPAGPTPPLPSELLGSRQMEELCSTLREQYDFIILDTPPVLAVTDALVISRLTDAVVLVVRYGIVQRHVAQRCIDLLERAGAHVLGVAINAVDFKTPEYSEYYGRKYSDYYGERSLDS